MRMTFFKFSKYGDELKFLFLVSKVTLLVADGIEEIQIDINLSSHEKCERCWHRLPDLSLYQGSKICSRCLSNLSFPGEVRLLI
jgi:isoleucyl-tRNA synthetase